MQFIRNKFENKRSYLFQHALPELFTLYPEQGAAVSTKIRSHLSQHATSERLKLFPSTKGTFALTLLFVSFS